ncbi:MAG: polysaccharide biosynthesis tyrosine autokinase [Elainellaceae cyanobacterium]
MLENGTSNSQDADLGYGQLFSVLLRRWIWIAGAVAIAIPIAMYNSLQKEPVYRSSMQLLLEPNYQESADVARLRVADNSFAQAAPLEIDYATQVRVMQSSELLERAVVVLQNEYPDISTADIGRSLAVFRVKETEEEIETSILQVDYTDNDPDKTQNVLNAMKEVYLTYNLEQQQLRLENGLAFIDKQLPIAREDVRDAELSLEQFRENRSLIDPEQKATDLANSLAAIEQELLQVQVDYQEAQARYDSIQRQLERSPRAAFIASRLSESSRYQSLLDQYQETELTLAELEIRFTGAAPNVRAIRQQLASQRNLLQQEVERILGESFASGDRLFSEGQLGEIDLGLVREIAQAQTSLVSLSAREQELTQAEQELQTRLAQFPALIAEYRRLQPDIETKRDTLQQLLRARQELSVEIARGGFNWQIVEAPQKGGKTGPSLVTDIILGGVAGLFLGVILAFVREGTDQGIHTTEEIRAIASSPVIGSLPTYPSKLSNPNLGSGIVSYISRFWSRASPSSSNSILEILSWQPLRDSFDIAYKNLQLLISSKQGLNTFVVTSPLPGEGKSIVTLGLALSAARLHQRVLVIDANLRSPNLQHWLGLPGDVGLSDILASSTSENLPIFQINFADYLFSVLPSTRSVDDPIRLLSSPQMHALLWQLQDAYDLIFIDSSSVLGTVDAVQLSSVCKNVLLVTQLNQISKDDLVQTLDLLSQFNVLGIITNEAQKKGSLSTLKNLVDSGNEKFLPSEKTSVCSTTLS